MSEATELIGLGIFEISDIVSELVAIEPRSTLEITEIRKLEPAGGITESIGGALQVLPHGWSGDRHN